jgi:methyl halide transferase
MRINGTDKAESWEAIYKQGDAGWDISKPAPPFVSLLEKAPTWLSPAKLISFGAGLGHDANFFANNGFQVTAVDFAPSAIAGIEQYSETNQNLTALKADIFNLPRDFMDSFDYVLEHTCFCAIPIDKRHEYMQSAFNILKPGGILFGLFYRFDPKDDKGPPFTTTEEEINTLIQDKFEIIEVNTPIKSHGRRQDRERFIAMKVKK